MGVGIVRHRSLSIAIDFHLSKRASLSIEKAFHHLLLSIEIFPVTCPMAVTIPPEAIVFSP